MRWLPALLLVAIAAPVQAQAPAGPPAYSTAVLQTLDKVTGRVRTLEAPVEETVRFGTLDIMVRSCRKRPPEEPPESAAFLEVTEVKRGETPRRLFAGWMFASSPAVSALEHPVYDVWVKDCTGRREPASGAPEPPVPRRR